ncbi:MAG: hypothetical protein ABL899_03430, partial [Nitrospira sp.]
MPPENQIQVNKGGLFYEQFIPLSLTVVVFLALGTLFYFVIRILNLLPGTENILLEIRWYDVLIGGTIYLKTSVDFAIFMGRLMTSNPGWKNRIAIEIGSAVGNGLGTVAVLVVWTFFKEIEWLLGLLVLIASLVLFELAYASLEHFSNWEGEGKIKRKFYWLMDNGLETVIKFTQPITRKILPDLGEKLKGSQSLPWKSLVFFSFSVPFILGLDDFAGYVPLFNIVNVFGFSIGVIGGHMLLNIAIFLNPSLTVRVVRNEWVSFVGALAFIGLGVWGLIEVV